MTYRDPININKYIINNNNNSNNFHENNNNDPNKIQEINQEIKENDYNQAEQDNFDIEDLRKEKEFESFRKFI